MPAARASEEAINLPHIGVFGLGFGSRLDDDSIIRKVFQSSETHLMIFRRGPFSHYLRERYIPDDQIKGRYSTGEERMAGCGEFKYFPTKLGLGWTLGGKVQIGTETYSNYNVILELGEAMRVPEDLYNKHFKHVKRQQDIPQFSFHPDPKTKLQISTELLSQYYEKSKFELDIKPISANQIILGRNFLSQYCVGLKADEQMENMEIGIAQINEIEDDAKYKKREEENNGDNDDEGKDKEKESDGGKSKEEGEGNRDGKDDDEGHRQNNMSSADSSRALTVIALSLLNKLVFQIL
ncbi:unnamed protein product [Bursaphelenchus xylophilus]|nr:unnamed protein product [Bursaphelenchus xylophilus]CAG9115333.1 unnamed protein product [Bursaphelenchus xylophilus]